MERVYGAWAFTTYFALQCHVATKAAAEHDQAQASASLRKIYGDMDWGIAERSKSNYVAKQVAWAAAPCLVAAAAFPVTWLHMGIVAFAIGIEND